MLQGGKTSQPILLATPALFSSAAAADLLADAAAAAAKCCTLESPVIFAWALQLTDRAFCINAGLLAVVVVASGMAQNMWCEYLVSVQNGPTNTMCFL